MTIWRPPSLNLKTASLSCFSAMATGTAGFGVVVVRSGFKMLSLALAIALGRV